MTADGPLCLTAEDPLFAATVGGLGQTGPILSATIQLEKVGSGLMRQSRQRLADFAAVLAAFEASSAAYRVAWLDLTAKGAALGRGIFAAADHADAAETPPSAPAKPLPPRRGFSVPFDMPKALLSAPTVRGGNRLRWHLAPAAPREARLSYDRVLFPLDRLHGWNRLYGRRGLYQFHCVLPLAAAEALRGMIETIASSGLATPLAVLKRLGPGRAGLLSFPMAGWTLAVDLAASDPAKHLIARLNEATAMAGGRVYLAKDALLTPELARAMYPELALWQERVNQIDPAGRYMTDLVRRLKLREP